MKRFPATTCGRSILIIYLGLLCGCSTYYSGYYFAPRPARVQAIDPSDQAASVVTLVSVIGVRRGDLKTGDPPMVELRMRLTNHSPAEVVLLSNTLVLVSGELEAFSSPRLSHQEALEVAPSQSKNLTVLFSFPDGKRLGETDLESLHLSWEVQIGNQAVPQGVTLTRLYHSDSYDGWGYPYRRPLSGFGYHRLCD